MGERITVPCQHCNDGIEFEVEAWAQPPERAYCDETCYEQRDPVTPKPAATA